jgi:CRISPR system Cascade subunit CasE
VSEDRPVPVLARARLRGDVPAQALARLFVPEDPGARLGAGHRLVWALFADAPQRRRDFLWREMRPGEFLILAARPPSDPHGLFNLEYKPFAPMPRPGQQLRFDLRANPVISVSAAPGTRSKRHDVVMHALSKLPTADRATAREETIRKAGAAWLIARAAAGGFHVAADTLYIDHYERVRIPRGDVGAIVFSALTFQGLLTILEPARFLECILRGLGAAKAYGCGLMLVRRAPAWP